jgi:hypothetical protein
MIGNIIDSRTDRCCPECDAVYEPSAHDNAKRPDGTEYFSYEEAMGNSAYFIVTDLLDTTVRDAVLHAERNWTIAVTVYLYDKGTRPIGEQW